MEAHGSVQVIHLPELLLTLKRLRIFCPWRGADPGAQLLPKPSQRAVPATPTSLLLAREAPRRTNTGDKCTAGTGSEANGAEGWVIKQKTMTTTMKNNSP